MAPAGLDGNPEPVVTPERAVVVEAVADSIDSRRQDDRTLLVAIDGVDGSGKSTFADEVARVLAGRGLAVVRSTIDSFHNPREVRWRRGRRSPEGFYRDSHDIDALLRLLVEPIRRGERSAVVAAFDEPSDTPVAPVPVEVAAGSIVLFDGIFLHRAELASMWDLSIYVDGRRRVHEQRVERATAGCPPGGPAALVHLAGWWAVLRRYVDGQRLYHDDCDPVARCQIVVANDDLARPRLERLS